MIKMEFLSIIKNLKINFVKIRIFLKNTAKNKNFIYY